MAKKGVIQETLKINIVTQLDNMDQTVKTMRDTLSNLNLGQSTQKEFNQILSNITERIKNLRATTKDGVIKFTDQNQITKDIQEIERKLSRLGIDSDFLSLGEKNLKSSVKVIEQMTAARAKYAKSVEKTNNEEKRAQERIDNWQTRKDNISQVTDGYNALAGVLTRAAQKAETTQQALKEAQEQLDSFMNSAKNDDSAEAQAEIQRLKKNVSTKKGQNTKAQKAVANAQANLGAYNLGEFKSIEEANKQLDYVNENLYKAKQSLEALKQQDIGAKRFEELKQKLEDIKDIDWSSFGIDFSKIHNIEEFDDILTSIKNDSAKGAEQAIEAMNQALQETLNNAGRAGDEIKSVSDQFDRLTAQKEEIESLRRSVVNFFGIQNVIQLFKQAVNEAYDSVKELDAAMTETAVVTDFSVGDMWEQLPEYAKMANDLGTTTLGAYETATLFYQQGLETNEVMEVSVETMKMARIAGMDYVEATNMMTAALRGFNMEINELSAQRVNDVYSELAKITASDTQEISTAMTKTASIAHNANMEFETTAAFLSQIIETTRESAETAGTAMKTIIARFTELKKNPNEIFEVDGEEVDANKVETALRSVGVALRDSNGEFRKLDDVFLDLAKKWDSLTTNQQRYVATMAAGSRQQSRFIAMMSDYDRTVELVNAAYNSAGSSQEQFEKTTESLESKINRLHNAWQEFTMNLSNNTIIKGAIDLLTGFLNVINRITTVNNTMNNSIVSFGLTLGVLIKSFTTLGKVYDKYGESFFGGVKNLMNLGKPGDIAAQVKTGTESGTSAAQAQVYKSTYSSIFKATRDGMRAGSKVANGNGKSSAKVKVKDKSAADTGEKIGEKVGEKVEEVLENTSQPTSLKQTFSDNFTAEYQANALKADEQLNKFVSSLNNAIPSVNGLNGGFKSLLTQGVAKAGSALGNLVNPVNILIASIAATVGVIKLTQVIIDKVIHTEEDTIKEMNTAIEGVDSRISSLTQTLTGITEQKDKVKELGAELSSLTKGTVEYEEARRESNNIIREILASNPELSSKASYEDGVWTPDSTFWDAFKKNTEEAIARAENSKGVLESTKSEAELRKATNATGINTTDITDAEKKSIGNSAAWGGGIGAGIGATAALVGTVISAILAAPVSGGFSLAAIPTAIAVGGGMVAGGAAGAGLGSGGRTIAAKTGQSQEDLNLTFSKLSTERGATFTDEEIKAYAEGVFEGKEAEALVNKVFGNNKEAQKFFKAMDGNSEALNNAIAALDRNTAQLSEEQYNATGGDAEGKYYYSTEAAKADREQAFSAVEDAVDWIPDWKEQGKIIEGTGKTVASYLDEILKDREGYTKDSKGRWTYEGKLLNLEKNDQLTNEIASLVAVDLQKSTAEKNKEAYKGMTETDKADYRNYQTERVKKYKSENWKDVKTSATDFKKYLTEGQQESYFKKIGVEEGKETHDQKRIAAYIQAEAEQMSNGDTKKAQKYYESALEYYNNSYDLKNISYDDFVDAVKDGIANSNITILNTEENKTLNEWSKGKNSGLESASEDARKNLYKLGTTFEGEGKNLVDIFKDLGPKADSIFANADLSSKEGIESFVKSLEDAGVKTGDIQKAFGVSLDELSDRLLSLSGVLPSVEEKAASAADAYTLANQIAQEAMMSFSQEQYDLITKMDSDLGDAFFKIGDAFYYTEGSAYQLAQALSTAATAAVEDYEKILNREKGIGASDYNKLSDDQKKNWKYNKQSGLYEIKDNVGVDEYQAMMETMGYSYEKALEYAAQLGDVNAILNSTAPEEKKTKALKAMALQYGAAAEEIKNLSNEELANLVVTKKQEKQVEASTKALKENVEKLKNLKKGSSEYKSMLATMAEEINVLGGEEGIVDSSWVADHMSDIKLMVEGDEAAAERVRKAWNEAWVQTQVSAEGAFSNIINNGKTTDKELKLITDTLYEYKLKGTADFTELYNALIAVGNTAEDVLAALQQVAGTDIEFEYEYEYVDIVAAHTPEDKKINNQVIKDMQTTGWEEYGSSGDTRRFRYPKSIKAVKTKGGDNIDTRRNTGNFTGFGDNESKGTSSSKEETPWENPYDRLYNLTQQINGEIRKRNRLESEYNRLVERGLGNASQLAAKTDQERKSLEQQKALQEQLLAERKKDIEKLNNNAYSKYAHYDMATGNVVLNYDAIKKNKDEDIGKGIEEQVSKLEELKSEIEGAEDALWDIEDQLYELTQRGRDEYIDFQKDVYNALIKQRQDEIDKYSEYISTLADAKNDILDELRKYIDKQRQERDNAEKEKEIADKDAQLFRMERDTGSTQSDIIAARKDVEQMRRDYTDDLIDQKISELEEQNDEAQKIREKQLEIMQKQLEQDQESGALWEQVKILMEEGWGPDGKIIEGSELERILADYYEYTQMSEEERAKAIEQRNMNTTLAKQYLDAKNAGKNKYTPSTSYPDVNKTQTPQTQTPKKNPSSNSGAKTLSVGTRVRTVGYGNAASDGSGGRAAKGLSGRKILKVRKGAKYPYLIGTSNDPSGWTGWYTASALQAYKKGGLANFTGPAWLDGTKTKPEAVLNARDTQNFLQLRDVLSDVLNKSRTIERSNSENNGDNYYDIDIQVDKLSNDYDVDQLVKKIKKEITRDANYRNVRTINLKR